MLKRKISSVVFYEALSFALSSLTGVLGAVPLMFLRREVGRVWFLIFNLALVSGLTLTKNPVLWIPYLISTLLVAFYFETEHWGYFKSGFFSVLKTLALVFAGAFIYFRLQETSVLAWATTVVHEFVQSIQKVDPSIKIDPAGIVKQLPSILFTVLGVTMWLAILFDRKLRGVSRLFGPKEDPLLNIKLPDQLVWLAITTLLFSFVKTPIPALQEVALNLLNGILLLYFFQGLSIVAFAFTQFQLGPFIRALLYMVFVTQLFLFVSILGILDYWLNFREKIFKTPSEEDKV